MATRCYNAKGFFTLKNKNGSKRIKISEKVTKYFKICFQNQKNICKRLQFIVAVGLDSKN